MERESNGGMMDARINRDGDGAHWKDAPFKFVRENRTVTSADTLTLRLAAGGGQAIRFVPIGRSSR